VSRFLQVRRHPGTVDQVRDLLLDWSLDARWRPAVVAMEVDPPGPAAPGQRILEKVRFAGLAFVTPTTIRHVDRDSASFSGGSAVVAVDGRRSVQALPGGGCAITLELSVRLRGPLAPLTPLVAPGYRRQHRAEADQLLRALTP
jgi:Polyketide cyclase / dehydrase and lipid transport